MRDLRLITPPAWFELDLDPATRRASIDKLVAERTGEAAKTPFTADLVVLLERHAAEAYERGAIRAAMFSEEHGGERVAAALVVLVVEGRGDTGGSAEERRSAVALGLAETLRPEGATEWWGWRGASWSSREPVRSWPAPLGQSPSPTAARS